MKTQDHPAWTSRWVTSNPLGYCRSAVLSAALLAMMAWLQPTWAAPTALSAPWHHPLYLDGGGYWSARVKVTVRNMLDRPLEGEPLSLRVGQTPDALPLTGHEARAVRVCRGDGVEMMFNLLSPEGSTLSTGAIPAGSNLIIPVECPANTQAVYWVYYDNPQAWEPPDFWSVSTGIRNGGMEAGSGDAPAGWQHDPPDATHRTDWVSDTAHTGRRCLKTTVSPGAEPTWISTRQSGIRIVGGTRYVLSGWVKARNVKGFAGWYIHVGNREKSMMIGPVLNAGGGTFDWKKVELRFTAPPDADRASVGTVLRGTGTAWFDDVTLKCEVRGDVATHVSAPERLTLTQSGAPTSWPPDQSWEVRVPVTVYHPGDRTAEHTLVQVDLSRLRAYLGRALDACRLKVQGPAGQAPCYALDTVLIFEARLAPWSETRFYVYASSEPPATQTPNRYEDLLSGELNRVRNPSFEQTSQNAGGWRPNISARREDGIEVQIAPGGRFGSKASRVHVPHSHPPGWYGWVQDVPVQPGQTYLYAGWLKCEGVQGGTVQLHAHIRDSRGRLVRNNALTGAGPAMSGTQDWKLLHGLLRIPEDGATVQLHLTTSAAGTVWHDGILLAPVMSGVAGSMESAPLARASALRVWPVRPVVKVFPDTPPPRKPQPVRIEMARNEFEPLQLALRSGTAMRDVSIEVTPPVNASGARLEDFQVAVVGYVPIDHPTSYYRSDAPEWHRKYPTQAGRCDGWRGWWPDPLLPRTTLDLQANRTYAVWITFRTRPDTPAGQYRGRIQFKVGNRILAAVPVDVQVWDFALPENTSFPAIYDTRVGRQWLAGGVSREEAYRNMWRVMAEHRLCPDRIWPDPVFRYRNGQASADFSEFDRAAQYYFEELNLPHSYTPRLFYLFGWGHPPKRLFGIDPYEGEYPYEQADRSRLRPEYKQAYQACLRLFWDHVKAKGWADRFVLYISDEPHDHLDYVRVQMKALCAMIHEVDPRIPIYSSTWHHQPEWNGALDVWGIGHDGRVSLATMARLRAAGDRLWFTTDGQMCTDTPYCAVERLLPHYCFHHDVEAYEFWGVSWLTYDPYRFGWHAYIPQSNRPGQRFWIRYPNGDGFLMYPGQPVGSKVPVPSVRLEQAREGVEDYLYLSLLKQRIAAARAVGRDTHRAETVLEEAAKLAAIPNAGGRYSTRILPDPEAVYGIRQSVARAIEQLSAH